MKPFILRRKIIKHERNLTYLFMKGSENKTFFSVLKLHVLDGDLLSEARVG